MSEWAQTIASVSIQWLEQGNPIVFGVLFLISTIVEIGIPVPFVQDTVLLYLGFEPRIHLLTTASVVMLILMAGRVTGASIIYWVARSLNPRFMRWLEKRSPKLLTRAQALGTRLGKRSPLAVTLVRLTPGLLTPSTIAAGLFRVRYLYFCIGVMASSVIPDVIEIASGIAFRAGIKVAGITPSPAIFIIVLLCFVLLVWLLTWLWNRLKAKNKPSGGAN